MSWHLDIRLAVITVVLALIFGGRAERLTALVFLVRGFLNLLAPKWDWMDVTDWDRLIAFQAVFVAILVWLLWRHRRGWLLAIVLLQCFTVGLEAWCAFHLSPATESAYRAAFIVLAVARSSVLAWAVLRFWVVPPRAAPATGDIDLYEAALKRGPLPGQA